MTEAKDDSILNASVARSEELPAMIVAVMSNVENRLVAIGNLPDADDGAIWGLVERPIIHGETSTFTHLDKKTAGCLLEATGGLGFRLSAGTL